MRKHAAVSTGIRRPWSISVGQNKDLHAGHGPLTKVSDTAASTMKRRDILLFGTASLAGTLATTFMGMTPARADVAPVPARAAVQGPLNSLSSYSSVTSSQALKPWMDAVANRQFGHATAMFIGDSVTEGASVSALEKTWGYLTGTGLRSKLPTADRGERGGGVFLPFAHPTIADNPFIFTGGGSASSNYSCWGFGRSAILVGDGQGVKFTCPQPVTSVALEIVGGNGSDSLTVSVDGVGEPHIGPAPGELGLIKIAFADRGIHSIDIKATGPGYVLFNAVHTFDGDESNGIRTLVIGRSGSRVDEWVGPDAPTKVALGKSFALAAPHVIFVELGTNEFLQGVAPATYQANLYTLLRDIASGMGAKPFGFVLLAHPGPYSAAPVAPWSDYVLAMQTVANSRADTEVMDLGQSIYPSPGGGRTDPQGLWLDAAHPSDAGSALFATTVADALTPSATLAVQSAAWVGLPLENSWSNYGAPFGEAQYRRDSGGIVHLRGLIKNGIAVPGTTLFKLPVAYRPSATLVVASLSVEAIAEIWIGSDGIVAIHAGTDTWLSLDNIRFLAEA
jgi:lysophospholipase L1-like esterase